MSKRIRHGFVLLNQRTKVKFGGQGGLFNKSPFLVKFSKPVVESDLGGVSWQGNRGIFIIIGVIVDFFNIQARVILIGFIDGTERAIGIIEMHHTQIGK